MEELGKYFFLDYGAGKAVYREIESGADKELESKLTGRPGAEMANKSHKRRDERGLCEIWHKIVKEAPYGKSDHAAGEYKGDCPRDNRRGKLPPQEELKAENRACRRRKANKGQCHKESYQRDRVAKNLHLHNQSCLSFGQKIIIVQGIEDHENAP